MKTLKQYRAEQYMTVDEFAVFLEVAPDTVYRLQAGRVEHIRPSTMRKIAKKLGVHPSEVAEFAPGFKPAKEVG